MRIKKRQFARLKDITEGLGGTLRPQLDQLIADIESVQKVKTIKEKPLNKTAAFLEVCAKYQEEFYANHLKQGESMVAASTDESTTTKGIRDSLKALAKDDVVVFMENYDTEPKIGDVGYFWTTGSDTRYGKIKEISSSEFKGETYTVYRIDQSDGCEFYVHFSKTPPELK